MKENCKKSEKEFFECSMLCDLRGNFYNHIKTIHALLSRPYIDINAHDILGQTPLTAACEYEWFEMVDVLLTYERIEINKCNTNRLSPLTIACRKENLNIIQSLLVYNKQRHHNIDDNELLASFKITCRMKQWKIAQYLINYSYWWKNHISEFLDIMEYLQDNLNMSDFISCTISLDALLVTACENRRTAIIDYLMGNKLCSFRFQDNYGRSLSVIYEQLHYVLNISFCLKENCKKSEKEFFECSMLCDLRGNFYNHIKTIHALLSRPYIDINAHDILGQTPLTAACEYEWFEMVDFLLTYELIDIDKYNTKRLSPLTIACRKENLNIIQSLLVYNKQRHRNIDDNELPALFDIVCRRKRWKVVQYLINYSYWWKNRAHEFASRVLYCGEYKSDYLNTVKCLFSEPFIDINKQYHQGQTPLTAACEYGRKKIVDCLLECKTIDINTVNSIGQSPLAIACSKEHFDFIKSLIVYKQKHQNFANNELIELFEITCKERHWKSALLLMNYFDWLDNETVLPNVYSFLFL